MNPAIYPPAYEFFGIMAIASFLLTGLLTAYRNEWSILGFFGCYGLVVTALHHAFGGWGLFLLPVILLAVTYLAAGIFWLSDWKYRKMKAKARETFPFASPVEVSFIAGILLAGNKITELRWNGARIVRGEGDQIERITKHGWRPLTVGENGYPYQSQKALLNDCLASLGIEITPELSHFICSLLYFNWVFINPVVEGEYLVIPMQRRDEKRIDRLPCKSVQAVSQALP